MIYRYARAAYLHHGGDPRVFDELPWRDIADWLAVHDLLVAREGAGGLGDDL